jgi:hypothetical protein
VKKNFTLACFSGLAMRASADSGVRIETVPSECTTENGPMDMEPVWMSRHYSEVDDSHLSYREMR